MPILREKDARRRFTQVAISLAVVLVIGIFLAVALAVAVRARNEAQEASELALSRRLAAEAELIRYQDGPSLSRGVLLALESVHRYPTIEGEKALRNGLAYLPRLSGTAELGGEAQIASLSQNGSRLAIEVFPLGIRVVDTEARQELGPNKSVRRSREPET